MPPAFAAVSQLEKSRCALLQIEEEFLNVGRRPARLHASEVFLAINAVGKLPSDLSITDVNNIKNCTSDVHLQKFLTTPLVPCDLVVGTGLLNVITDCATSSLRFPVVELTVHAIAANAVNLADVNDWRTSPVHEVYCKAH